MIHTLQMILNGVLLLLLRLQCCRAAPGNVELISDNQLDSVYVQEMMRQSKAAEMASFMNKNIDPCENFYDFACGNWAQINPANKESDISTGLFENLIKGFDRKLKQMLKSSNSALDTPEDLQVKSFYVSCTQQHEIDKSYQQKLKQLIAEFGSMPALEGESWQESEFDWLETIARIANRYGLHIILEVEVERNFTNNEMNVVYIGQQKFLLESRGMYLEEHLASYREKYRDRMAHRFHKFLGLEQSLALSTAKELIDFEVRLAEGLVNEGDGQGFTELMELTTVAEMQRKYAPILDVERLVNVSLGESIRVPIYEFYSQYQRNLIKAMQGTRKSIVANYIFYQLIDNFSMNPGKTPAKQDQMCIKKTTKHFSKNLDNMIYRRYNNNATSSDIELIWRQLKSTFNQKLESDESLDWISRQTRNLAIEKLAAMRLQVNSHVGENLAEQFVGLKLQSVDYVENLRQIHMKSALLTREKLHQPVKPLEFGEDLSFTPANILAENIIKIPIIMLQPYYMWAASYPNAIKFGTLASPIGHELIHGFDDSGRKFDALGNVLDWWDEQSAANFVQRQQCFMEQYSRYSYNGKQLPKVVAQAENIADNGGLRLAYDAYRNWQDAQKDSVDGRKQLLNEKLPTLNYTNKQLFFISYAQFWCNDVDSSERDAMISMDQHVPGELRVIGTLSNFDEFSKEFQCGLGTAMNPRNKCQIY